jgi:ribonuclease HII
MVNLEVERGLWVTGIERIAGVDEAGRGPLAGPVVAAAVIFSPGAWIDGVDDSKKLSAHRREKLFDQIYRDALSIGVSVISHEVIDRINIYQATMQAMEEAIRQLSPAPQHLLIDGPRFRESPIPAMAIVDGDAKCFSIAAASIVAKVTRDRIMIEMDARYPEYGFARHKGYGTKEHLEALRTFGPCQIHRRSFRMPRKTVEAQSE